MAVVAVVLVVLVVEEVIVAVMLIFKLQQEEEGGRRGNRDRGRAQKSQDLTVSELFQAVSDSVLLSLASVKRHS